MTSFRVISFRDPRDYQIAVLGSLLTYGLFALQFDVRPGQVPLTLATVLATQWVCTRLFLRAPHAPQVPRAAAAAGTAGTGEAPQAAGTPATAGTARTAGAREQSPTETSRPSTTPSTTPSAMTSPAVASTAAAPVLPFASTGVAGSATGTTGSDAPRPRPRFDPKSALISGLSLCLLLRTESLWLVLAASIIAVASKFLVRIRGKHVFNPTNGAIVALMLTSGVVWVSPGQWGNVAFFAFLMACLGGLVVHRALRSDVTYAFVIVYGALLFGRSLYLGEPLAIPWHRLQSGALLLFTFFMISDPRTTPDSRTGRVLFASLVAFGAWYVQFRLFRTNGLLWSLAAVSLLTPLIDLVLPGRRYDWPGRTSAAAPSPAASPSPRLWERRPWFAAERTSS